MYIDQGVIVIHNEFKVCWPCYKLTRSLAADRGLLRSSVSSTQGIAVESHTLYPSACIVIAVPIRENAQSRV